MRARIRVPLDSVDIFLDGVTRDDITALLKVLEPDRNHAARSHLYTVLRNARELMDKGLYDEMGK